MQRTRSLADAHAETLLTDRTPDVPIRTSDVWAERFVARVAARRHQSPAELVSATIPGALRPDREERQLVERIAVSFALPLPFDSGEITPITRRLDDLRDRLEAVIEGWKSAVGELAQNNLDAFLAQQPRWVPQVKPGALVRIPMDRLDAFQSAFLGDLAVFSRASPNRYDRLRFGHERWSATAATAQRAEARSAALLRARTLLTTLVARQLLEQEGSADERAEFAALRACEEVALPGGSSAELTRFPRPMPAIDSDERIAVSLGPTSLGALLAELPASHPGRDKLPGGAMAIVDLEAGSPAERAGLQPGDILLGAPDEPVHDRGAMKLFLATPTGSPERALEILRGGQRLTVQATPTVAGKKAVELPQLPAAARAALDGLVSYRGPTAATMVARKPYLLFFWATWCGVCKRSIPELMDLQRTRNLPVVAITDESPAMLDAFFGSWSGAFPEVIALDPGRRVNEIFEVEALPTYVLIDENRQVRLRARGYNAQRGLRLPRWQPR